MRAVRFTKAEHAWLTEWVIANRAAEEEQPARWKIANAVLGKLNDAVAEAPAGVAVGPLEQALVRAARGKVVELASGGAGYARASKLAAQVGATVEDAEVVGAWLARQGWLREPTTLIGVLNKWAEWLPRARATAPPPAAREGFDGAQEAGPRADGARRGGGGRGGPEGFR